MPATQSGTYPVSQRAHHAHRLGSAAGGAATLENQGDLLVVEGGRLNALPDSMVHSQPSPEPVLRRVARKVQFEATACRVTGTKNAVALRIAQLANSGTDRGPGRGGPLGLWQAARPSYLASRPSIETLADLAVRVRIPIARAGTGRCLDVSAGTGRHGKSSHSDPAASQRD